MATAACDVGSSRLRYRVLRLAMRAGERDRERERARGKERTIPRNNQRRGERQRGSESPCVGNCCTCCKDNRRFGSKRPEAGAKRFSQYSCGLQLLVILGLRHLQLLAEALLTPRQFFCSLSLSLSLSLFVPSEITLLFRCTLSATSPHKNRTS